jgi:chorismate-pyruvate lyase
LTPELAIAGDASLSLLQKTLLITDGTVTQLLEVFTGEKIQVEKLEHGMVTGGPAELEAGAEPVLSRRILLRGPQRAYMFAQSWLVPARLPAEMLADMAQANTPMGQLWKSLRLETYREIVDFRREEDAAVATLLGEPGPLLTRRYLIHRGGRPMGLIAEKFSARIFA